MIKIISDSACDLSEGLLGKYNISILPLHVILDKSDYRDGVDITTDEIYDWADVHRTTPKTSAASIDEAINMFKPILEGDNEIICFAVSEEMSDSYNVMKAAAEALNAEERVHVINSANVSSGVGMLVLEAAILASNGMDVDNIIARMEEFKAMVKCSFVVDTLSYLKQGGRCEEYDENTPNLRKIHPMMVVEDGKMSVGKEYHGHMNTTIPEYVRDLKHELLNANNERVFITHTGCSDAIIEDVQDYLERLNHFKEIHITRAGSVISSHCGYGALGVLYMAS